MSTRGVIPRDKLRGRPLLDMCKNRPDILVYNECGEKDNRIFCYGFKDCQNDEPLRECIECGAWVWNATPLEVGGQI